MNLVIRAVALAGTPLTQAITGYFDERGGTIGRSDSNTLALPDPKRHISRVQLAVSHADGGYAIRNVGSANPIALNDRPVLPGETAWLTEGDELQIGPYLLRVDMVYGNQTVRTITRGRAAVDAGGVVAASSEEPKTDVRQHSAARSDAAVLQAPDSQAVDNPLANLLGTFRVDEPASRAAPPAPVVPSPGGAQEAAASASYADLMWAVFREAAGISLDRPHHLTPERMRVLGAALREAIHGALDGVLARFSPDSLEGHLSARTLDGLPPMDRRAKLWQLYLEHFGEVSREARDHFQSLFDKALVAAYAEQLDQLDVARRSGLP